MLLTNKSVLRLVIVETHCRKQYAHHQNGKHAQKCPKMAAKMLKISEKHFKSRFGL